MMILLSLSRLLEFRRGSWRELRHGFAAAVFAPAVVTAAAIVARSPVPGMSVVSRRQLRRLLAPAARRCGARVRIGVCIYPVRLPPVRPVLLRSHKLLAWNRVHPKLLVLPCQPGRVGPFGNLHHRKHNQC